MVAGPGNNGGDGFVAARLLAERGYRVDVLLVGEGVRLKGDAAHAAKAWTGPVAGGPGGLAGADVVIDALFGAGLDRPVEGLPRAMIEAMNAQPPPVVAVDLPSGINGTSGAKMGVAVKASQTVTFFRKKPGHVLLPGRLLCGPISVADIGIPDSVLAEIAPQTFENIPRSGALIFRVPSERAQVRSRTRGRRLRPFVVDRRRATRGPRCVTCRRRAGHYREPARRTCGQCGSNLAVMVRPVDGARELKEFLSDRRLNALAIGPGTGVGERHANSFWPPSPGIGPSCSTQTRSRVLRTNLAARGRLGTAAGQSRQS